MLGIGLDFGTTNSTIAIFDGTNQVYIDIDNFSENKSVMPTALYLDRNFQPTIGSKAIKKYLKDNEGRRIQLQKEDLGEIRIAYADSDTFKGREEESGDTTVSVKIHAMTDKELPGLLYRSLKRWLGIYGVESIKVFDMEYRIVALITPILFHIVKNAKKFIGNTIKTIHVGRPVRFEGPTENANSIAEKRLAEALKNAGLEQFYFYPEPVAAHISYFQNLGGQDQDTILTFDFGGGTLDLCIVKIQKQKFKILATHGLEIGGDKIDKMIYETKIFPELGKGSIVTRRELNKSIQEPFRFEKFSDGLLNWQHTYTLNNPEYIELINQGIRGCNKKSDKKLEKLLNLIQWNFSYSVFKAIEQAKMELANQVVVPIEIEDLGISSKLTKEEFNEIINPILLDIEGGIDKILDLANISQDDITVAVRTGGSSLIPAVKSLLEKRFHGKVIEHDVFKSISAGLSIASFRHYKFYD